MPHSTKTSQAKPVTSAITDAIASAEVKRDEEGKAIRSEVALIDSHLPAILRRARDAVDGAGETADIEQRLARFETVPEGDYARSVEADLIAKVQSERLTKRRAGLIKSLPGESRAVLAERVGPVLATMLPGVEVHVTNAPTRTWHDAIPTDAVAVVLVQEPGHDVDRSTGLLSGKVSVYYFRLPLYASINVEVLERAAKAARINIEVTSNVPAGASLWQTADHADQDPRANVCDRLSINVNNVIDGLPTIGRVETTALHSREWVTTALRQNGCYASPVPVDTARFAYLWMVEVGPRVWVTGHRAEVLSERIANDRRTVVVEQKINTHNVDPTDFVTSVRSVLATAVGYDVSGGLGLLQEASVEEVSQGREGRTGNYRLALTYVSEAPSNTEASA